jgi:phage-related minor tail protein
MALNTQVVITLLADGRSFIDGMEIASDSLKDFTADVEAADKALRDSAAVMNHTSSNFTAAGTAAESAATKIRMSRQQMLALGYTASDVAASMASGASPFTVMMQQGGQLLQAFPGIIRGVATFGVTAAAVAIPVGIVGSRIAEAAENARNWSAALGVFNKDATASAEALSQMASAATVVGGSRGELANAATILTRMGGLRFSIFDDILRTAPNVASLLGTDIPQATAIMGTAFSDGWDGVEKLNRSFHFLTEQQQDLIKYLYDTGSSSRATMIAMEALEKRVDGAAAAMRGAWGDAMHEARRAWDALIDSVADTDISQIIAGKISGSIKSVGDTFKDFADYFNDIEGKKKKLDDLNKQIDEFNKNRQSDKVNVLSLRQQVMMDADYNNLVDAKKHLVDELRSLGVKISNDAKETTITASDYIGELRTAWKNAADAAGFATDFIEFPFNEGNASEIVAIFEEAMI